MTDMLTIDIGHRCTHCLCPTDFGSGNYVDRIPSGHVWRIRTPNDEYFTINVNGHMCAECQSVECDGCGESTLEYDENWLCPDCSKDHSACDYTCDSPAHY